MIDMHAFNGLGSPLDGSIQASYRDHLSGENITIDRGAYVGGPVGIEEMSQQSMVLGGIGGVFN